MAEFGEELRSPLEVLGEQRGPMDRQAADLAEHQRVAGVHEARLRTAQFRVESSQHGLARSKLELLRDVREARDNGSSAEYLSATLDILQGQEVGTEVWRKFHPFSEALRLPSRTPVAIVGKSLSRRNGYYSEEPMYSVGVIFGLSAGDVKTSHDPPTDEDLGIYPATKTDREPEISIPLIRLNGFVLGQSDENREAWSLYVGDEEAYDPNQAATVNLQGWLPSTMRITGSAEEVPDRRFSYEGATPDQSSFDILGLKTKILYGEAVTKLLAMISQGYNSNPDSNSKDSEFPPRLDAIAAALSLGIGPSELAGVFSKEAFSEDGRKLFLRGVAGAIARGIRADGQRRVLDRYEINARKTVPILASPNLKDYFNITQRDFDTAAQVGLELGTPHMRSNHYDDTTAKRGSDHAARLPIPDAMDSAAATILRIYGVTIDPRTLDASAIENKLVAELRAEVPETGILDRF